MLCDWLGYKEDITLEEAEKLIRQQCDRYHFSDTMQSLLYNTLKNYFVVTPGEKNLNELFRKLGLDKKEETEGQLSPNPFEEVHHIDILI